MTKKIFLLKLGLVSILLITVLVSITLFYCSNHKNKIIKTKNINKTEIELRDMTGFLLKNSNNHVPKTPNNSPFYFRIVSDGEIKKGDIEVIVSGANKGAIFAIRKANLYEKLGEDTYVASYIPKNSGKDKIIVSVGDYAYLETNLDVYETDSFVVPISLISNSVLMNVGELMQLKSKKKIDPIYYDNKDPFEIDLPGHLSFEFESKDGKDISQLDIYQISSNIESSFSDPKNMPAFVKDVKDLKNILKNKDGDIKEITGSFPKPNAAAMSIGYIKYINSDILDGVRHLVAGHFQEVGAAQQPTYHFQGITKDGNYLVVFEYQLFSEKLKKLRLVDNNYEYQSSEWNEWIKETFSSVKNQNENSFIPTISELDKFIKSIQIKDTK